jgi:hypothetical protein
MWGLFSCPQIGSGLSRRKHQKGAFPIRDVADPLTMVTDYVTYAFESRSVGRGPGGNPGLRGECGARGQACNPRSGGFGYHPLGTTTGARVARWT